MFTTPYEVHLRWADLDPNFHLRHSSYYDLASQHRMDMLNSYGLTATLMEEQHFAPVLLREECVFLREIRADDKIHIQLSLKDVVNEGTRWTLVHQFINVNNKRMAELTVDISWLNINTRRIARPLPEIVKELYNAIMRDVN
jgi:acyl-CoA thioester hydrolase